MRRWRGGEGGSNLPSLSLSFKSGKVDRGAAAKTVFGGYSLPLSLSLSLSLSLTLPKDLLPNFFFRRLISTSEGEKKVRYYLSLRRGRETKTRRAQMTNVKVWKRMEGRMGEGSSKKVGWGMGWVGGMIMTACINSGRSLCVLTPALFFM